MQRSDTISELATALAKAQGAIRGASKDSVNPHLKSKYADLASVWQACREALASNGLSIVQLPMDAGANAVGLTTILLHTSGEYLQSDYSAPLAQNSAQSIGSALTYLRRYALAAMVGVAPEEDDGESASQAPVREMRPASPPVQQPRQTVVKPAAPATAKPSRDRLLALILDRTQEVLELGLEVDLPKPLHEMSEDELIAYGKKLRADIDMERAAQAQPVPA